MATPNDPDAFHQLDPDDLGGGDFSEGPQFDPERGVVYPEARPSIAAPAPALAAAPVPDHLPDAAPEPELGLDLEPICATPLIDAATAAPGSDDEALRLRQPLDGAPLVEIERSAPTPPGEHRYQTERGRFPLGLILLLLLVAGLGAAFFTRGSGAARAGKAPAAPSKDSGGLGGTIEEVKAQGRELREKVEAGFAATRRGIEGLTSQPLLIIESTPSGAEIWLDGEWLGNTPFAGDNHYASGPHQLRLGLEGYRDARLSIEGGESSRLSVELRRK